MDKETPYLLEPSKRLTIPIAVLRDFIADHGFQIMMGTHDSVHANFFKRKLQNDGVPVKVYSLVPTENGVVARLQD